MDQYETWALMKGYDLVNCSTTTHQVKRDQTQTEQTFKMIGKLSVE